MSITMMILWAVVVGIISFLLLRHNKKEEEMSDIDLMRNVISVLLVHSSCIVYRVVMSTKCVVRSGDVGMSPAQGALLVFMISKLTHLVVFCSLLGSKKTKGRGRRKKAFLWCTIVSGLCLVTQTTVSAEGWGYSVWILTVLIQCVVGAVVEIMALDFFLSVMSEWVVDTIMRLLSVYLAITVVAIAYVMHVAEFTSCLKLCLYHTLAAYVSIGILYNEKGLTREDPPFNGIMVIPSSKNILVYSVSVLFLYCPISIVITQLDIYMVEHLSRVLDDEKDACLTYLIIALTSSVVSMIAQSRIKQLQSLIGIMLLTAMTINGTYVGVKYLMKNVDTVKAGYLLVIISFHVLEESLKRLLSISIDKEEQKAVDVEYSVNVLNDLQLIGMHTMIAFVGTLAFGMHRSNSEGVQDNNLTIEVLESILKCTWKVIFPVYLTFVLVYNMNLFAKDFRIGDFGCDVKVRSPVRRGEPKIYLPNGRVRDVIVSSK